MANKSLDTNVEVWFGREDALRFGVLIDITDAARAAGFACPTAITNEAYVSFVKGPDVYPQLAEAATLKELLETLYVAKSQQLEATTLFFSFWVRTTTGGVMETKVKSVFAYDEHGSACITVTTPEQGSVLSYEP